MSPEFDPPLPPPSGPDMPLPERQEEFIRLLNGVHSLLLRYVMSLVGNRHDAEDVLQRASVTMWRRFASFESGTDFVAWATTVAFYEVRNFQRVVGRSRLRFDEDLLHTLAAEQMQFRKRDDHRREALEDCVGRLTTADRDLVEAVYQRGEEIKRVAERAGRPVNSFYNRLGLIRRTLAECVQRKLAEVPA